MQTSFVDPAELVRFYQLQPHPEGGWYRQSYRSPLSLAQAALPPEFTGDRPCSTAILFLLEAGNFSAFHRIRSDEAWHFYTGDPLEIFILSAEGQLQTIVLGPDWKQGQQFQYVVPASHWFASRPAPGSRFALVGCTVAPGFDFADFEMATADRLAEEYPAHRALIQSLCR